MVELYLWDRCPYCQKVLRAAREMGLQEGVHFEIVNSAPGTMGREIVEQRGGDSMVPFLVDDEADVAMYESDDIIAYLRQKF